MNRDPSLSIPTESSVGKEAIERLAAIVASSDDAIFAKDMNGIITHWNRGAEKIFGYTAKEAVGKKINFLLPPGHLEQETHYLNRILAGEAIDHFALELIRKDGKHIIVSTNVSPIFDALGKVVGVSRIARDITEQQRAYEALIEGNKELLLQKEEKAKRAEELHIANQEKAKRVDELFIANQEKSKRVDELIIANRELKYQTEEKAKRAAELLIANEEKLKLEASNVEKLHRSLMDTIGIARELGELRDPYTAGHERHVGDLAKEIAAEMGLDEHAQMGLKIAGYLHDIGKIVVPEAILSKPTKLSTAEYNLIKDHVKSGYDLLQHVSFPWDISRPILEHHERIDGSGYPNSLVGDQISLEGRIMAVADVVDAMSAHRPYRPALGMDAALTEIKGGRGRIYDEKVVDACITLFREKGYAIPTALG